MARAPERPDLYRILQVDPSAEPEVIEAAYRRLALKYHPDVNRAPNAADRMRDLNMAYEVLGDSERRAQYDHELALQQPRQRSAGLRRASRSAPPRLRVDPQSLQFGPMPKGSIQTAVLQVTMDGVGSLRGSVRPNQPWVRTNVSRADGSTCTVEVTVDTANLRDGWRHAGSVTIGTVLGGSKIVPVTVEVEPEPKPAVRVEPEVLDFGEVYAQAGLVARELRVVNGGTGVLSGHVNISHAWVSVSPERFSGNEHTLSVTIDPSRLKIGRRYTSRLFLETNGGIALVPVRVQVSEIVRPLPPPDSPGFWYELISRLLPQEKWERDLTADLLLRAQQRDWRPTEQQRALIARIKSRGLED